MMKLPALIIDRIKFKENAINLKKYFDENGMKWHLVTKCFCAYEPLVEILAENGCRDLADSRLENLARLNPYVNSSLLLRLPMLSEVHEVVRLCDMSLNSEWEVIGALSDAALTQNRVHGIVLMVELGDRREGIFPEQVDDLVGRMMNLRGVRLVGLGANFNCYGGIIPDQEKMDRLAEIATTIQARYHCQLEIVSGGNSGSLHLLDDNLMPRAVNHLRIGEAFLLGRETSFGRHFHGLNNDVFTFRAEVIEADRKPSLPEGLQGLTALGEKPHFEDRGMIHRVILAFGAQDVNPEGLQPRLSGVRYLGCSSDHAIYDVTEVNRQFKPGDTIDFDVNYSALNRLFTSNYIHKVLN